MRATCRATCSFDGRSWARRRVFRCMSQGSRVFVRVRVACGLPVGTRRRLVPWMGLGGVLAALWPSRTGGVLASSDLRPNPSGVRVDRHLPTWPVTALASWSADMPRPIVIPSVSSVSRSLAHAIVGAPSVAHFACGQAGGWRGDLRRNRPDGSSVGVCRVPPTRPSAGCVP